MKPSSEIAEKIAHKYLDDSGIEFEDDRSFQQCEKRLATVIATAIDKAREEAVEETIISHQKDSLATHEELVKEDRKEAFEKCAEIAENAMTNDGFPMDGQEIARVIRSQADKV